MRTTREIIIFMPPLNMSHKISFSITRMRTQRTLEWSFASMRHDVTPEIRQVPEHTGAIRARALANSHVGIFRYWRCNWDNFSWCDRHFLGTICNFINDAVWLYQVGRHFEWWWCWRRCKNCMLWNGPIKMEVTGVEVSVTIIGRQLLVEYSNCGLQNQTATRSKEGTNKIAQMLTAII